MTDRHPTAAAPLAEVTRGTADVAGPVESRHVGHLVVAGPDGEVVHAAGDPDRVTFVRSAAKPFQAAACLEVLGGRAAELTDDEVAVAWASHRAEPAQLAAVRQLLGRSRTTPDELTCPPSGGAADPSLPPARLLHNCSGKHALFALTGLALGIPRERLLDPGGELQRLVAAGLEDVLGPPAVVATDGCGAPAVAVPLRRLAGAFAALASDDRWRRVREAGLARPGLVGGHGRLETALLAAGVLAKPGAEGVLAAGWVDDRGGPRGLAVKVEDGADRAASVAAHAVLVAAGSVEAGSWAPEPVLGGGAPVGEVRSVAALPG